MKIPINLLDEKRVNRVCRHEAGHYLVAKTLSFNTHGISIVVNFPKGHSGGSTIEPSVPGVVDIDSLKTHLKKRIQVLFAGAIAEAFENENSYDSDYALRQWKEGGGMNDHAKIRELIHVLRNISFPDSDSPEKMQIQLTELDLELVQLAGDIVSSRLRLISSIGMLLRKKVTHYDQKFELSEDEIYQIQEVRTLFPK